MGLDIANLMFDRVHGDFFDEAKQKRFSFRANRRGH
jgi:hypothetical protein